MVTNDVVNRHAAIAPVIWDGVLEWCEDETAHRAGFALTNTDLKHRMNMSSGFLYVIASVNTNRNVFDQVHVARTTGVRPAYDTVFESDRDLVRNPATLEEGVQLFEAVKTYWRGELGGNPTDRQLATMVVLDEVVTRWYRRDRTASELAVREAKLMVASGMSLETIYYYASSSFTLARIYKRQGYFPTIQRSYITFELLEQLKLVNLPLDIVKVFLNNGALPELETRIPRWI